MQCQLMIITPHRLGTRWAFEPPAMALKRASSREGGPETLGDLAQRVYGQVWRRNFTAPGFCVLVTERGVDSHALRSSMGALKEELSEINRRRTGESLVFRPMGRFHQQETTKFHLDGAPDRSLLMRGYEPSKALTWFSLPTIAP